MDLTLVQDDLLERWWRTDGGAGIRWTSSHVEGGADPPSHRTPHRCGADRPVEVVLEGGTTALHLGLEAQASGTSTRTHGAPDGGCRCLHRHPVGILVAWEAPLAGNISAGHTLEDNGQHTVTMGTVSLVHNSGPWDLDTTGARPFNGTGRIGLPSRRRLSRRPPGKGQPGHGGRAQRGSAWLTLDVDGVPAEVLPRPELRWTLTSLPSTARSMGGRKRTGDPRGTGLPAVAGCRGRPYTMGDLTRPAMRCRAFRLGPAVRGRRQTLGQAQGLHSAVVEMNQWPLACSIPCSTEGA